MKLTLCRLFQSTTQDASFFLLRIGVLILVASQLTGCYAENKAAPSLEPPMIAPSPASLKMTIAPGKGADQKDIIFTTDETSK